MIKSRHLFLMQEILMACILVNMIEMLPFFYPRSFSGLWAERQSFGRTGASILFLAGLWLNGCRVRDRVETMDMGTSFIGAIHLLCLAVIPFVTTQIVSYRARFVFQLYGGAMLSIAVTYCALLWRIGRLNGMPKAVILTMRIFLVASGLLLGGLILASFWLKQTMWYIVFIVGLWLLLAPLTVFRDKT